MISAKELVKQHWDEEPCGTRNIPYPVGSLAFFETISEIRDKLDPEIVRFAQFDKWAGKEVLEVGCGVGSDLIKFAQAGAFVMGIDLSSRSVFLARERLRLYKIKTAQVIEADAESMPFKENTFDLVFSYGVLHHTPNIEKAISEIYRVTKPGGKICIMLYNRHSLVSLQMWIMFGLLKGKPFCNMADIFANHHESLGTKTYTVGEVDDMFCLFDDVKISTVVTSYDLRYGRDRYSPMWVGKLIPQCLGWNLIIQGRKP